MFEEIHLSDKTLRTNYVNYWNNGDFNSAYSLLSSSQLTNKLWTATVLNALTTSIVALENNDDPTFKEYRIQVSSSTPSGLSSGRLWFETEQLDPPIIITQPTNVTANIGETISFSVVAEGIGLNFQWWYEKPDETTWNMVRINGTSSVYTLTTEARHSGYKYKCIIQNSAGSATTNVVTLTLV